MYVIYLIFHMRKLDPKRLKFVQVHTGGKANTDHHLSDLEISIMRYENII